MIVNRKKIIDCIEKVLFISEKNFNHFSNSELSNWINIKLNNSKEKKDNKMNTKFRSEKSVNGFDLSSLKSGLQKYIRRGNEEMALRIVEELDRFAEVKDGSGEKIRTNMIHRLQIIFLEDIGLGNYELWGKMAEWIDILLTLRKSQDRNRALEIQTLEQIVRNLCRSKKTRAASFMRSITQLTDSDEQTIMDYFGGFYLRIDETDPKKLLKLFDTSLSKKSWTSICYFKKLFDLPETKSSPLYDIEKIMEKYVNLDLCKKWKRDILKLAEGFILYMIPLGFYLYGSEPLQFTDAILLTKIGQWPMLGEFKMDDFVYDKHTKNALDRSNEYFVMETSKVENEVFRTPSEFKAIYEWSRCGKKDQSNPTKVLICCHPRIVTGSIHPPTLQNHWWGGIGELDIIKLFDFSHLRAAAKIDTVDVYPGGTFTADVFSPEFISSHIDEYDLIFVPDCDGIWYKYHFERPEELASISFGLSKMLKQNGMIIFSKFLNDIFYDLLSKKFSKFKLFKVDSFLKMLIAKKVYSSIQDIERETDLEFVVRIQLTTSNSKQDTYYAKYNDELYFVKGPFSNRKVVDEYIHFQNLKKERGIPYLESYCIEIYPDLWKPEEIPLGFRKSIDQSKKYPFLISKSVFPIESLKFKQHSSTKWPVTTVVDDRATDGMRINVYELKGQMMIDYLNALAFRMEYNIGDFADRNFLIIKNRVLSVDEEVVKSKLNLQTQLREKYEFVKKSFEKYKDKLHQKTVEILQLH